MKYINFVFILLLFRGNVSSCQTFSINPNDTLFIENLVVGEQSISDIFQLNVTTNSLTMAWERVSIDVPSDWSYVFCDWGACYPTMPDAATMVEIVNPDESSFLGLTLVPQSEGSGMLQVRVWDVAFPDYKVLCAWYFSTDMVGLREKSMNNVSLYPNPATDVLTIVQDQHEVVIAKIIDNQGRTLKAFNLYNGINEISLEGIESGHYLLQMREGEKIQIKRFCVL